MSPLKIIAIVLLVLSVILAIMTNSALNPTLLAVWSAAFLYVFGGVIP